MWASCLHPQVELSSIAPSLSRTSFPREPRSVFRSPIFNWSKRNRMMKSRGHWSHEVEAATWWLKSSSLPQPPRTLRSFLCRTSCDWAQKHNAAGWLRHSGVARWLHGTNVKIKAQLLIWRQFDSLPHRAPTRKVNDCPNPTFPPSSLGQTKVNELLTIFFLTNQTELFESSRSRARWNEMTSTVSYVRDGIKWRPGESSILARFGTIFFSFWFLFFDVHMHVLFAWSVTLIQVVAFLCDRCQLFTCKDVVTQNRHSLLYEILLLFNKHLGLATFRKIKGKQPKKTKQKKQARISCFLQWHFKAISTKN